MPPSLFISPNDFKWAHSRNCQSFRIKTRMSCMGFLLFAFFPPSTWRISRINIASENMEKKQHHQASIGNWFKIYIVFFKDRNIQECYTVRDRRFNIQTYWMVINSLNKFFWTYRQLALQPLPSQHIFTVKKIHLKQSTPNEFIKITAIIMNH